MADVITTVGKNAVAEKIGGLFTTDFEYLALGYDGTTAAVGDTALTSEATDSGLARLSVTPTTDTANVLQLVGLWTCTADGKVLRECGVLSEATTGVLLAHSDFNSISVDSDDSIQITYKITVS